MRRILLISLGISAISCTGQILAPDTSDLLDSDAKATTVVLEGAELQRELAESPVREAPVPFVRIGGIWDAASARSLEIATSVDGESFTAFAPLAVYHTEAEQGASFVGELELAEPAYFYRLRAAGDAPTFASLEFLDHRLSDVLEDGAEPPSGAGDLVGETQQGLTVGDAVVNDRAAWGARAPRCQSSHSPFRITIHHTVTPTDDSMSPQARLRQIQAFHQDVRGWCDIGYHFLVSRDGRLWQGRPSNKLGSHVGGANSGNVGISFMGTHTATPATQTQIGNVGGLVRGLSAQYGITISATSVKGHRDRGQTSCPGDSLYAQLAAIIDRARGGGGGGGGGGEEPPPAGTSTIKGVVFEGTDTAARIPGATVQMGELTTTTGATGYYEFANIATGTYQITVTATGFRAQTISREAVAGDTWASVGMSRDLPTGTAVLQGVVYTDNDSANRIPGATIVLSSGQTTTADENGFYRIRDLAPGQVTISASKSGFPTGSVERTLENGITTWGSVHLP